MASVRTAVVAALARRGRTFWICSGLAAVALLGLADYLTGPDIAWSFFYLIPISSAAWFAGRGPGAILSVLSALVWWAADVVLGHAYADSLIGIWNAIVALGFFLVVTWLAAALHRVLQRERALARVDFITGALNPRAFSEALQAEAERCRRDRRPFSLVYMDVDNFKAVNDVFGHTAGDELLQRIAETMRRELRGGDIIARLGGDEFAILLPETPSATAMEIMGRLRGSLLRTTREHGSSATLSMGLVACERDPGEVDDLIRCADDLMYHVKEHGKNGIRWAQWRAKTEQSADDDPHLAGTRN
ncbi:diguanylate cyclase [Candidatus Fermentibacteria bacterium]|nr:diguanylate cyclase [Candidatus Fermentibacteria bacterium]